MNFFRKVWTNKSSGQKMISIPVGEKIDDGEYVMVSKIDGHFFPNKKFKTFIGNPQ